MTKTDFFERSRIASEQFLQTAVVVDDQPYYNKYEKPRMLENTPGRRAGSRDISSSDKTEARGESRNDLKAKLLVDSFAAEGIVCAILQPVLTGRADVSEKDTLTQIKTRADKATARADIVVLDWNLRGEPKPGDDAKKIIYEILKSDKPTSGAGSTASRRLRLIAVYTGESGLAEIADELEQFAIDKLDLGTPKRDGHRVEVGPVTFVVYGKKGETLSKPDDDDALRIAEDELPGKLLDDFTSQTSGLLSNVALASLSAIRDNTHRIISRFNSRLDASYVAHRAMTTPPAEAVDHPVPLVASELESVLADTTQIREHVGIGSLKSWLESLSDAPMGDGLKMDTDEFRTRLSSLLETGLKGSSRDGAIPQWDELLDSLMNSDDRDKVSALTDELTPTGVKGRKADAEYAVLTSVRTQYDHPAPSLRLGSVIRQKKSANSDKWIYRLCVQPLCDSVRFDGSRLFPFVRLQTARFSETEDRDSRFEIVVNQEGSIIPLRVSLKVYEMEMIKMKADPSERQVVAARDPHGWVFPASRGDSPPVRWVADLKTDFAQRIANRFGTELSRVGLTESEWLRRMDKAYPKPVQSKTDPGS